MAGLRSAVWSHFSQSRRLLADAQQDVTGATVTQPASSFPPDDIQRTGQQHRAWLTATTPLNCGLSASAGRGPRRRQMHQLRVGTLGCVAGSSHQT